MSIGELTFEVDAEYDVGERISATIDFPGAVSARCEGKVLRAEPRGARWLVAATIERFAFFGSP